jgi:hypothetical protein
MSLPTYFTLPVKALITAAAIALAPAAALADSSCDRQKWMETLKYCGNDAKCRGQIYKELMGWDLAYQIDNSSEVVKELMSCVLGPYR